MFCCLKKKAEFWLFNSITFRLLTTLITPHTPHHSTLFSTIAQQTQPRVVAACTLLKRMLFKYQGHISAALVLGGVDVDGPHVYQIYPHGSTGKLPYTTMGSGSLAAMAVYESEWQEGMSEADAVKLVQKTVLAGIFNDLGSGSNCDICIIRSDGTVENIRGSIKPNDVAPLRSSINRSAKLTMRPGTTPILSKTFHPAKVTLADVTVTPMET
jgi:20S proteasome subunit beta 2